MPDDPQVRVPVGNLQVLFESGPLPGTAKDHYIGLFTENEALINIVKSEAQEFVPKKMLAKRPGFGAGSWVMASMDLKPGKLINLAPYYGMQSNSLSGEAKRFDWLGRFQAME